jgi:hypothetical protein
VQYGRSIFTESDEKHPKLHRVYNGAGADVGRVILLLTTGENRFQRSPLQYEEIDGKYYLGWRGTKADWVRNIQCNPQVDVRVKSLHFHGQAEVVTEPARIADFIEVRLQRHPLMIGTIMQKAHGLPKQPSREQLEKLAEHEALVIIPGSI